MTLVAVHRRSESDTPWGAPQAPCNCGRKNEGETIKPMKPESKRLNDPMYNLDVAHYGTDDNCALLKQIKQSYAFVLAKDGEPLMPMKLDKAKRFIHIGKAVIKRHNPFQIQLTYETTQQTQPVKLGIDTGYQYIGFSCVSEQNKKEYICGTLEQEANDKQGNPTKKRLQERAMYRRTRRSRLWHRKKRFLNRKKDENWIAPSIQRKYHTHINLINLLKKLLPIMSICFEVGRFDTQKLENPSINGEEYQQGNLYGFVNIKAYLMYREHGICQYCGCRISPNEKVHIHHIRQRSKGGTDKVDNLALLHDKCHVLMHHDGNEHLVKHKKSSYKQYTEAAFMNIVNRRFKKGFPDCEITFGCYTSYDRQQQRLAKTHYNDAFVIAGGQSDYQRSEVYELGQKRRNDRQLQWNNIKRKGSGGRRVRKGRGQYHSGDLIWLNDGTMHECKGMSGGRLVIDFKKTKNGNNSPVSIATSKVVKYFRVSGIYFKKNISMTDLSITRLK